MKCLCAAACMHTCQVNCSADAWPICMLQCQANAFALREVADMLTCMQMMVHNLNTPRLLQPSTVVETNDANSLECLAPILVLVSSKRHKVCLQSDTCTTQITIEQMCCRYIQDDWVHKCVVCCTVQQQNQAAHCCWPHSAEKLYQTGDECKAQAVEDDKLVRGASQPAIC